MLDIENVIDNDLCVSCGLCSLDGGAEMSMKKGINLPIFKEVLTPKKSEYLNKICPGKGYPIVQLGKAFFEGGAAHYDYRLGHYLSLGAATTNDEEFLRDSTSGGMMPMLANYLLEEGKVDGVLTVKFEYTDEGPIPKPFIALSKKDLMLSQGSKYRPIPLLEIIDEVLEFPGVLAVIGTPCQIAGIRLLQEEKVELKDKIKYTIANFCGGYRDYRETERIFDINKVQRNSIKKFSYRGNGQPGYMSIEQKDSEPIQLAYPDYARLTGYTKYYRCRTCVDATGELADISFGDAWLPRFLHSGSKWSFYIARSSEMQDIIEEIKSKNKARFEKISFDDLVISQRGNLTTKKERQNSRFKFQKLLGRRIPVFDGGYNLSLTNIFRELKVSLSHNFMLILEKVGLYLIFARLTKRVKK